MSKSYEFGKVLPDQITSERLQQARLTIEEIVEAEPQSIQESVQLAERLQGVSRAIGDIVLSQGAVESTDLSGAEQFDPDIMPRTFAANVLRRFKRPDICLGKMFVAQPGGEIIGASMGVHEVTTTDHTKTKYHIILPSDRKIDRLLMQEPCLWDEDEATYVYSSDFRGDRPDIVYPFSNRYYEAGDATKYFRMLQELSAELLDATSE